jgi:DNA-binding NarL/FixJ family response regulator
MIGSVSIAVAIVEDDVETRKILSGWIKLSSRFRLVGEWGDALNAVGLLPEAKPEVVLVDINLQIGSGIDVVRQLKPVLPKTQFLMVTVYQDADHIYEALAAGATGYLLKQTSMDELTEAIEEVHAGGSPMTSIIARKVTQAFAKPSPGLPADVKLSAREQEVLDLLARGFSLKEVADKLEIRMPSVKTYVRRMYEKLHVCSRTQAVAKYAHLELDPASSKSGLG